MKKRTMKFAIVLALAMMYTGCPTEDSESGGGYSPGELMTRTVNGITINFRYVPDGKFQRYNAAADVTVITKGYWLGETEVTQDLFEEVMETNPSIFDSNPETGERQEKRPVDLVSWNAAIAFCNKLSLLDGKQPVYSVSSIHDWSTLAYSSIPIVYNDAWNAATQDLSKDGYRLPTEMEWMWAAMGADKTEQPNTSGYLKPFAGSDGSNSLGDCAWSSGRSNSKTHEVGLKMANELGIYDMSGNVSEWVWDRYGYYFNGVLTDPTGPIDGRERVCLGGGWNGLDFQCGIASGRTGDYPSTRSSSWGFRILCP